ncbi:ribosome biogenesis GTPase [Cribrihabitans marinus]|uniref:Small ribosomal subunit biogenesis GTPase RsgA n=1 Tax=Cribrihabitans marinus TaxID=1227549 RepID=A0A1H7AGJ7_9RHOB|nr:ribosome small subunit-dependent GTPase A [Cribrihabitans marinus]GGH31729.1 putative ribosome biogenesis GTPase RsgA 2 [Cribrihabitans marinus]SEJ64753.1 ribosome biogenesis GTPase [Cribrihabitans marinus]
MTRTQPDLAELGWKPFFSSQLDIDDLTRLDPARVMAVHRGRLTVTGPEGPRDLPSHLPDAEDDEDRPAVGDWIMLDRDSGLPLRILDRFSLFKRRAPGTGRRVQLIAANVDTLFIVSSCNRDFNLARLERYLVLARDAGVTPVVVLTKADLADAPGDFAREARGLQAGLLVEAVNALDRDSLACLSPWCGAGQTVAMLGSSGVGKSTLVNTLSAGPDVATAGIREDDAKGRHTTTGRAMHRLAGGGWLIDTPGMRELQLTDAAAGLEDVFADVSVLAQACRFADCAHETEPGCAVRQAIDEGRLDPVRLARFRKLTAEDARNSETLAQRRARGKAFGKMIKSVQKDKRGRRE